MALVLADRVKETTTTTGTGAVTLLGASPGFQSFSVVGNANTTYYCISEQAGSAWEVGIGTYTSAGTVLSRDTVLSSSNAGALVSFGAGTKDVFVTYPSEKSANLNAIGTLTLSAVTTAAAPLNVGSGATTTSPTTPVAGDIWINDTEGLRFNYNGVTRTAPRLEGTNSFSGTNTFSSTFSLTSTTGTVSLGTTATSGVLTLGGTSGTGIITLGRSTVSQTTNIQAGATASGSTKTVNFGTGGLSGSTTAINIGSAVSGATTNIAINGTVSGTNNIPTKPYVAAMNILYGL